MLFIAIIIVIILIIVYNIIKSSNDGNNGDSGDLHIINFYGSSLYVRLIQDGSKIYDDLVVDQDNVFSSTGNEINGIFSGSFSGSYIGDGSQLTGVGSDLPSGVVSGSSQIDVTQTTNYSSINQYTDADNLSYMNTVGVVSGSVLTSLPTGVVSGSSQISFTGITDKPTLVSGSSQITIGDTVGLLSGSRIIGDIQASSVEYTNVLNKPTLVSGSSQITYSGISGIPSGIVSGSSQITYSGLTGIPSGIVSGSSQIDVTQTTNYGSINQYTDADNLSYMNAVGVISGSSQISYTGITNVPSGIVSGSSQIDITQTTNYADIYKVNIPATNTSINYDVQNSDAVNNYNAFSSSVATIINFNTGSTTFVQGEVYNFWRAGTGTVQISGSGVTLYGLDDGSGSFYINAPYSPVTVVMESATVGRIAGNLKLSPSAGGSYTDDDVRTVLNTDNVLSGSIHAGLTLTSVIASGSFSGSFQGDGSQLTGVSSDTVTIPSDITSTSYTILTTDGGNRQTGVSNASPQVLTFDSAQSYSQGEVYNFWRKGTGTVEITGSGVTLYGMDDGAGSFFINDQYSPVTIVMESTTIGRIAGNVSRPSTSGSSYTDDDVRAVLHTDGVVSGSDQVSGSFVQSNLTGEISGSEKVINLVVCTQAEYDAGTALSGSAYLII